MQKAHPGCNEQVGCTVQATHFEPTWLKHMDAGDHLDMP